MRKPLLGTTFFALFSLILLSSMGAFAQTRNATTMKAKKVEAEPSPFSIALSASTARSLYDFQDGTRKESNDFEVIPSYRWSQGVTSAVFTYSADPKDSDNSDFGDIAIINSLKGWDFSRIKLSPSINAVVPESKASRELYNLNGALGVGLTAAIQEKLLIPGFYFKTSIGFNQNFHRFETALNGAVNNKYSSRQSIFTGYSIGMFSFDFSFAHINAWSYAGNMKEAFEHAEEASLSFAKHYAVSLGHTNSGSVFKANGTDSNVQLIDDKNSLVYAKVSLRY